MMKTYNLYAFVQDNCAPCDRFKNHLATLTEGEQAEIHLVPLKTAEGKRTALAEELAVSLTPTLVVTHTDILCDIDRNGDEFCDQEETTVEHIVGANKIIELLQSTLDSYTYVHPE